MKFGKALCRRPSSLAADLRELEARDPAAAEAAAERHVAASAAGGRREGSVMLPARRHPLPPSGRAPSGRPLCRWCRKEIPAGSRRSSWCSKACVDEYLVRSNPGRQRRLVWKRDRGVCAICRVDTDRVKRILVILHDRARLTWSLKHQGWDRERCERRFAAFLAWVHGHVAATAHRTSHLWEADHITPIAEGGGSTGLENLRTLCKRCHARETGALRRRLNAAKSPQLTLGPTR